jgi:cyclopropane-fatty-acyl-phospholipid synthase
MMVLERKLNRLICAGRLTVIGLTRKPLVFGQVVAELPHLDIVVRLRDRATGRKIGLRPGLCFGEAYMDGALLIEQGTLRDLLELCGRNFAGSKWHGSPRLLGRSLQRLARACQQFNSRRGARHNVAHHYDLSDVLFRNFLDTERHYSCAYFRSSTDSLEAAQQAKTAHIAAKLLLQPSLIPSFL